MLECHHASKAICFNYHQGKWLMKIYGSRTLVLDVGKALNNILSSPELSCKLPMHVVTLLLQSKYTPTEWDGVWYVSLNWDARYLMCLSSQLTISINNGKIFFFQMIGADDADQIIGRVALSLRTIFPAVPLS